MLNNTTFLSCVGILFATALLPTGCDPDYQGGPTTAEVVGSVFLDGQPVPNAKVVFIPYRVHNISGKVQMLSYATTDAQGNFTLHTANGNAGVAKGFHRVVITKKDDFAEVKKKDPADHLLNVSDLRQPAHDEIPIIYNQQSKLMFNVETSLEIVRAEFKLFSIDPMLEE